MYKCSHCGHTMDYPYDICPSCHVLLSGVRCEGCGYVGAKQEFISNQHHCPKCGAYVEIPQAGPAVAPDSDAKILVVTFLLSLIPYVGMLVGGFLAWGTASETEGRLKIYVWLAYLLGVAISIVIGRILFSS